MSSLNKAFKIISLNKPKCFAEFYFPFTKVDICNCVDYCKYTPPAIANPIPSKYITLDKNENITINIDICNDDIHEKVA